jgi:class 3 adenylate cyclase
MMGIHARDADPMLSQPESACLVIADISGYTGFLAGAELDHAQDILADLMGIVVGALRPQFRLAKLEGDAAFAYALTDSVDGPRLQDTIERCYFAFRRRLRDVGQASTCECNACILVPRLDLKVVAHYGQVIRQRIASREELVGSDVIVVHRLV